MPSSAAPARLLVSIGRTPDVEEALGRAVPGVPVAFIGPDTPGPWPDAEAWLVGSVRRELPGWTRTSAPRLRFVQRVFTGLDGFPFEEFPPEVQVAGNVGAFAPFVAEHAVALLLAATHEIVRGDRQVRAGTLRPAPSNRYLPGRTVLLLGFGAIARETATRLKALGARLEAVTRTGVADPQVDRTYPASRLREAVSGADVIIECRPLTRSTRATIDADALGRMRPDAILVNVGRAGTVDEGALYEHLRTTPTFRAALDVWWQEDYGAGTLGARFPFRDLPNVLGTPHVAAIGSAARHRALTLAAENLARFFRGEPPLHVADRAEYVDGPD